MAKTTLRVLGAAKLWTFSRIYVFCVFGGFVSDSSVNFAQIKDSDIGFEQTKPSLLIIGLDEPSF